LSLHCWLSRCRLPSPLLPKWRSLPNHRIHLAIENETSARLSSRSSAESRDTDAPPSPTITFSLRWETPTFLNEVADKPPVDLKLADGETRFTPGNFAHIARNLSDQPFRNVTIELMEDDKLRTAPSPWPMEVAIKYSPASESKCSLSATARASRPSNWILARLFPAIITMGRNLMVASATSILRSDVEGKGPMPGQFKSGAVKWLPGGYTHTLDEWGRIRRGS